MKKYYIWLSFKRYLKETLYVKSGNAKTRPPKTFICS